MPVSRGTAIDEAARARYIDSTTGTDEETEIAPNSGGLLPRILSPPFRVFAVAIIAVALTCPALAAPTWPSWPSLSEASASASNIVPAEYTPSAHGEVVGEAAIRAAFAAVVDPFGAWFVQENNADEGWTSQLSLLFGFGGEGTMSVLVSYHYKCRFRWDTRGRVERPPNNQRRVTTSLHPDPTSMPTLAEPH